MYRYMKKIIITLVLIGLMANIASAANDTSPFSPGNARIFWDNQDQEFREQLTLMCGLGFLVFGLFIVACFGGSAMSYSAHKSGQFADPEKKAGGASSMIGIIFILLGFVLCLSFVKPYFGF